MLVTLDTTRADRLGCYGYAKGLTPNLDAMAGRGVRFERALTVQPLTQPSHASVMTGLYPVQHTVRVNGERPLPKSAVTLAECLDAAGYETAAFVAAAVLGRDWGLDQGFQHYDDEIGERDGDTYRINEQTAGEVNERVFRWLDAHGPFPRPFFFWIHYFDPHAPYSPPTAYRRPGATPYDCEVTYMDEQFGQLRERLDEVSDNPLLWIVTADHGESLGQHGETSHGYFVYDATMRVPLLVEYPDFAAGRVVEETSQIVCILPTVLEFLGLEVPAGVQAPSLLSHLLGRAGAEAVPPRGPSAADALVESFEGHHSYGWSYLYGYESQGWKYIDSPIRELYRLDADPEEQDNLAGDPDHHDRLDAMDEASSRWRSRLEHSALDSATAVEISPLREDEIRGLGYTVGGRFEQAENRGPDLKELVDQFAEHHEASGPDPRSLRKNPPRQQRPRLPRRSREHTPPPRRGHRPPRRVSRIRRRRLIVDTDLGKAFIQKAYVLGLLGRIEERNATATRLLELMESQDPEELRTSQRLDVALSLAYLKRDAEYHQQLEETVRLDPSHPKAMLWLAKSFHRRARVRPTGNKLAGVGVARRSFTGRRFELRAGSTEPRGTRRSGIWRR